MIIYGIVNPQSVIIADEKMAHQTVRSLLSVPLLRIVSTLPMYDDSAAVEADCGVTIASCIKPISC